MVDINTSFIIDMHTDKPEFVDTFHSLCEGYTIDIDNGVNYGVSVKAIMQNISCIQKLDTHVSGCVSFENMTVMQYVVFIRWLQNHCISIKGMAYTDSSIRDNYVFEGDIRWI